MIKKLIKLNKQRKSNEPKRLHISSSISCLVIELLLNFLFIPELPDAMVN